MQELWKGAQRLGGPSVLRLTMPGRTAPTLCRLVAGLPVQVVGGSGEEGADVLIHCCVITLVPGAGGGVCISQVGRIVGRRPFSAAP
jgi:hypothetical protein